MDIKNNYKIKKANLYYLNQCLKWLENEYTKDGVGIYLEKDNFILPEFEEGKILVCIDKKTDKAIALLSTTFSIMSVKQDYQRKGLGTFLVKNCLKYHVKDKFIQIYSCTDDATKFWLTIGFKFSQNLRHGALDLNNKNYNNNRK